MKATNKLKTIQHWAIVALFGVFTLLAVSCSKNDDAEPQQPDYETLIIGKWKIFTDYYFQESGTSNRELVVRSSDAVYVEFFQNGTMKNGNGDEVPYTINGNQLDINGMATTITKLDRENLVFEEKKETVEYNGKTGTEYDVFTGTRQ